MPLKLFTYITIKVTFNPDTEKYIKVVTEGLQTSNERGKRQFIISVEHHERQTFLGSIYSKKQLSREFSLDPFP